MTGRKTAIGLSLLCALLFSAFAAQSASATAGTTAFTCVKGGGSEDFADAHCDESVGTSNGEYGHVAIGESETKVDLTNAKTTSKTTESKGAIFKSTSGGIALEITCASAEGAASIKDIAKGPDGEMAVEGAEGGQITFSECKMPLPVNESKEPVCKVKEPILTTGSSMTRVEQGSGKNTMGVELKPPVKEAKTEPFTELTFENIAGKSCFLNSKTVAVTGTAMGTGARGPSKSVNSSGATLLFTTEMTKETLKFGAAAAEFEASITVSMTNADGKTTENPVALTTIPTVGNTAFTCVKEGGSSDFADEHCDEEVGAGKGKYGHVAIGESETTVELTNAKTTNKTTESKGAIFKSTSAGIPIEITCAAVQGDGKLKNIAVGPDGGMAVAGNEGGTLTFSKCKMPRPFNAAKEEFCKVKEPILTTGSSMSRVEQGLEKNTMGVDFKPTVKEEKAQPFTELSFENFPGKVCFLNGKTVQVTGTAMATGARGPDTKVNSSGATLLFTTAMTAETLKFGTAKAEFEASITTSRTNADGKTTESPVTLTTTAS